MLTYKSCSTLILFAFLLHLSGLSQNSPIDSLRFEISAQHSDIDKGLMTIELAKVFRELSADSALFYFELAATYFDTLESNMITSQYYYHRGEVLLDVGLHDDAMRSFNLALTQEVTDSSVISTADILDKRADVLIRNGDYDQASDLLMKAIPIFEKTADLSGLGGAYNSMATVMERSKRLDKALEYYQLAYENAIKANDLRPANGYLVNIAINHSMQKEHRKAIPVLQQVIDYAESNNEIRMEALSTGNLGVVYKNLDVLDTAELYVSRALGLFEQLNNGRGIAASSSQLSTIYLRQNKNQEIVRLLEPQYSFAKEQKFAKFEEHIARNLRDAHENLGNYREALKYAVDLNDIIDSTVNKQMISAVNDAQTKYETNQKEAEIERLALQDDLKQHQISQQRWILIGFAGVIGVLSFLFHRIRKQKEIIEQQNEENKSLLKEIHHRVKNNLQVISSLLKLQSRSVDDEITQQVLLEGQDRVRSMSLIHQNLYQDGNLKGIQMKDYLSQLSTEIVDNYHVAGKSIDLQIDIEDIQLDVDSVVPIGLIVNELMTNSIKYAFARVDQPKIVLQLGMSDAILHLHYEDNGSGFVRSEIDSGSIGMRLIRSFSNRLQADVQWKTDGLTAVDFLIDDFDLVK